MDYIFLFVLLSAALTFHTITITKVVKSITDKTDDSISEAWKIMGWILVTALALTLAFAYSKLLE